MSVPLVQSSGGSGIQKTETTTQTGDPRTTLKTVDVPDNSAFWLEVYNGAFSDDGSTKRSATWRRLYRGIKSGGTIDQLNIAKDGAGNDESEFTNEQATFFSDGDLTVSSNGSGGVDVDGDSPKSPPIRDPTTPSNVDSAGTFPAVDPNNGDVYLIFRNTSTKNLDIYDYASESQETVSTIEPIWNKIDIAIDSNGVIHIAFIDETPDNDIQYAENSGGTWTVEAVTNSNVSRGSINIDLDQNGIPHIAYDGGDVRYGNRIGGAWSTESVVNNVSLYNVSFYVESDINIGIFYSDSNQDDAEFVEGQSGSWSAPEAVDSNYSLEGGLDWDSDNAEWKIAYAEGDNPASLKLASGDTSAGFTNTDTGFTTDNLAPVLVIYDTDINASVIGFFQQSDNSFDLIDNASGSWVKKLDVSSHSAFVRQGTAQGPWFSMADHDTALGFVKADEYSQVVTITHKTGTQVINA